MQLVEKCLCCGDWNEEFEDEWMFDLVVILKSGMNVRDGRCCKALLVFKVQYLLWIPFVVLRVALKMFIFCSFSGLLYMLRSSKNLFLPCIGL